jgi:zinc transporter ZupT
METFILALLLSLLAGLSTSIGSFLAISMKRPSPEFISFIMGFSAGVMILISFVELLQQSIEAIGFIWGISFFFLGMVIMFIIDVLVSHEYEFEDSIEILINNAGKSKPHLHYGHRHRQRQHHRGAKREVSLVKPSIFIFLGVLFITSQRVWLLS